MNKTPDKTQNNLPSKRQIIIEPLYKSLRENLLETSINKSPVRNIKQYSQISGNLISSEKIVSKSPVKNPNLLQYAPPSETKFTSFKSIKNSSPFDITIRIKEKINNIIEKASAQKNMNEETQRNFKKTKPEKPTLEVINPVVIDDCNEEVEMMQFRKVIVSDSEIANFLNDDSKQNSEKNIFIKKTLQEDFDVLDDKKKQKESEKNVFYDSESCSSDNFTPSLNVQKKGDEVTDSINQDNSERVKPNSFGIKLEDKHSFDGNEPTGPEVDGFLLQSFGKTKKAPQSLQQRQNFMSFGTDRGRINSIGELIPSLSEENNRLPIPVKKIFAIQNESARYSSPIETRIKAKRIFECQKFEIYKKSPISLALEIVRPLNFLIPKICSINPTILMSERVDIIIDTPWLKIDQHTQTEAFPSFVKKKEYQKSTFQKISKKADSPESVENRKAMEIFETKKLTQNFAVLEGLENDHENSFNIGGKSPDLDRVSNTQTFNRTNNQKQVKSEMKISLKKMFMGDDNMNSTLVSRKSAHNEQKLFLFEVNSSLQNSTCRKHSMKSKNGSITHSKVSVNLSSPDNSMLGILKKIIVFNKKMQLLQEALFVENPQIIEKICTCLDKDRQFSNYSAIQLIENVLFCIGIKANSKIARTIILYIDPDFNFSNGKNEFLSVLKKIVIPFLLSYSKIIGSNRQVTVYQASSALEEKEIQLLREIFKVLVYKIDNLSRFFASVNDGFLKQMFFSFSGGDQVLKDSDIASVFSNNQKIVSEEDFRLIFQEFNAKNNCIFFSEFRDYVKTRFWNN